MYWHKGTFSFYLHVKLTLTLWNHDIICEMVPIFINHRHLRIFEFLHTCSRLKYHYDRLILLHVAWATNNGNIFTLFLTILFVLLHQPMLHDDIIKWKHIPRYWPLVRGIHQSPANSPHKGQWREALMFPLWRHRAHYDVTIMFYDVVHVHGFSIFRFS